VPPKLNCGSPELLQFHAHGTAFRTLLRASDSAKCSHNYAHAHAVPAVQPVRLRRTDLRIHLEHYLKLFLGHAAYAQTLVLAIFMGGMALGSWLCSRFSGGWKNLLVGYALAEAVIGVCALVFHSLFVAATDAAFDTVLPVLASEVAATCFKWSLGTALILPQSILLGMTFPLMSGGLIRRHPDAPGDRSPCSISATAWVPPSASWRAVFS